MTQLGRLTGSGALPGALGVSSHGARGDLRRPTELLKVLLFALIVMTISRIHQHYGFLAALRPGLVLVVAITGLAVLQRKYLAGAPGMRTWQARMLAGMAAVACLSAPLGISLGASFHMITEAYWKVLFTAALLLGALHSVVDLWFFVWAVVVGCGILTWLALFVFKVTATYGSDLMRLQAMYTYDGNDLCVVLLVGLPFALLAFQVARNRTARVGALAVMLGIGAALAKSGSRGGFLGTVAVGVTLLFVMSGVSVVRRVAFLGVVALALVQAAPPGYWNQMRTLLKPSQDYNWSAPDGRRELWKRGFSYMFAYPVFGVGIGNFGRAEGTISLKARRAPVGQGIRWTAPHNTFVQVGAELGITGLVLYSSLVFGGIVAMFRLRRRIPPEWRTGSPQERFLYLAPPYFATAMVGFAVSGAFVSHAFMDHFYILVCMMAALSGLVRAEGLALSARRPGASARGGRASRDPGPRAVAGPLAPALAFAPLTPETPPPAADRPGGTPGGGAR